MAHAEDGHHSSPYAAVFGALCVCTALSFAFDFIEINHTVVIVLVMSIAVAKALFVMTYFMHLKFEGNWKLVLLAPTAILAIGLPLALMPDIGINYYDSLAPQAGYDEGHHAGHGDDDTDHKEGLAEKAHDEKAHKEPTGEHKHEAPAAKGN